MAAAGYPIERTERRLVAVQLSVAAGIGLGAWLVRMRLDALEPIPDEIGVFAALFHPNLWIGLALYAVSYLLIAAALGYATGTLAAVGWLASGRAGEGRHRAFLIGGPFVVAAAFVVVALVIV